MTVIPVAEAIVAQVSPCLAVTLRVQAAAACWDRPRARSRKPLVSDEVTILLVCVGPKRREGSQSTARS